MPLDQSFVGRKYPPTEPYEVGRAKIGEFARAIGDLNPAYLDPEAARALGHPDVIAPPTFPIVITMPAGDQAAKDPELGLDYTRVVHGDQRFVYERPLRAGDRVVCEVSVEAIRSMAGNDMVTIAAAVRTVEGELVCTAYGMLVARGADEDAPAGNETAGNETAGES
jgi:acyl dehydratase